MKTFDGGLLVRNRTSAVLALAATAIVVGVCTTAAIVRSPEPLLILASYVVWAPFIALAYHLGWVRATTRPARFDVSNGKVSVDGETLREHVARARILVQPPGRGAIVELRRRHFDPYPARVTLPSEDEARAFVRALGLDPREGTTRFRAPLSRFAVIAITIIGTLASALLFPTIGLGFGFLVLLAMVLALARLCTQTITIGQDGILIEGFPRTRFLPYAKISRIWRETRFNDRGAPMVSPGFIVTLEEKEQKEFVFIDTTRERMRDLMFEGDHLFDAAKAAHALAHGPEPRVADVLARGGRPIKDWLAQLDGAREVRYRVAAISDEELAGVLANPTADKTARAAAAICLARAGEDARVQVRVAAEDIAEPDVRNAALAALEDDEDALTKALESLE